MDHRWGKRIPVDIEVRLACGSGVIGRGRLANVSSSGAFVRGDLAIPLLSRLRVTAEVRTTRGTHRLEASAFVTRHAPNGTGLEWLDLAPAALAELIADPPEIGSYTGAPPTLPLSISL